VPAPETTTARGVAAAVLGASLLLAAGCGGSGPPGDELAFVSSRDGDYAVFGMDADGSHQGRLTDERGDTETQAGVQFQTDPAWSPDGRRVAFASAREGSFDIFVMQADGTGTRRLTATADNDQGPTWSPDGSQIAFARSKDGGHVWVMDADGAGARRLTDDLASELEPAWSPDGRWIAYSRRAPGTDSREVWIARPDGSGRRQVTSLGAQTFGPDWAPDSERLAFYAAREGVRYDIFTIGIDGNGLRRLVRSSEDVLEPAWSPDGRELAFARGGAIVVTTLDGDERELTDTSDNDSSPDWNPAPSGPDEGEEG
jgi:Tol biopolymer transport system component